MSAIDGLLELLARFEPHGTLKTGKPAKRHAGMRPAAERGPIAEKLRLRYAYTTASGTVAHHLPFAGHLHPARCGAIQSQTRSVRLDTETSADVAAALSWAAAEMEQHPTMPQLLGWLMRATAVDAGNSREGRWSVALQHVERENQRGTWRQRVVKLPEHLERLPEPPRVVVIDLAAEVLAEARFRRWMNQNDEQEVGWWEWQSERIAEMALFAAVNVSCCRRCGGSGIEVRKQDGEDVRKQCGACAGVGWVSIDRRSVAKALGLSRRQHEKRTEPAYRWAFTVTIGRLQSIAYEARRALRT